MVFSAQHSAPIPAYMCICDGRQDQKCFVVNGALIASWHHDSATGFSRPLTDHGYVVSYAWQNLFQRLEAEQAMARIRSGCLDPVEGISVIPALQLALSGVRL